MLVIQDDMFTDLLGNIRYYVIKKLFFHFLFSLLKG